MPFYNPKYHHRQSIRLKGYDYSQQGLYFITICCHNRAHLFGHIQDGVMVLNAAGHIAQECWRAIPDHFPNIVLHEYVIMPNHVHGVVEIVGAKDFSPEMDYDEILDAKDFSPEMDNENRDGAKDFSPRQDISPRQDFSPRRQPNGTSKTIGSMVRGFKIGVTKWMRNNTNVHDVWQRNYYEHIIRNDVSYNRISNYIVDNPRNWKGDTFFSG